MTNFDPWIEQIVSRIDEEKPSKDALAPKLPTDDGLLELEPNTGLADALIEQLETEKLVTEACDLTPGEFRKITAHKPEPTALAKSVAISACEHELNLKLERLIRAEVNSALIPLRGSLIVEERLGSLAKGAPARRAAITKMLRPLRSLFHTPPAVRFERLTDAMAEFVTQQIINEA
jgi:hypothetical protein